MQILRAQKSFWRSLCSAVSHRPLHVCIVGSGPAGFYTADKMLKAQKDVEIDIIDRLPTPFGLVRSGVAPDHQETKVVVNQFTRIATNEKCSFFGNVCVGSSISLAELRDIYDVVVLSYGAESDRSLGIPGEDLGGVLSAREFVWWYNGHPDYSHLAPNLKSGDTAIILGQGNVALDAARILLRKTEDLASTDISNQALESLKDSTIRKVYLVGRRGPVQAACTAKELREILGLKGVHIRIEEADLAKTPKDEDILKESRTQRRVFELLSKAAASNQSSTISCDRQLHFVFFRRPDSFLESVGNHTVGGVKFEKTYLREGTDGKCYAVGSGQLESLKCGLVLKSIGYKSVPVEGLPFDDIKGIVPNARGRVLEGPSFDSSYVEGLYVSGWLKRGPTGIIATNLYCAEETVASIMEDLNNGSAVISRKDGRRGLLEALKDKNITYVPFSGWEKIDAKEKYMGSLKNKPREKITSWDELLQVALGETNNFG